MDEGTYVCQAENAAGVTWTNLTLRVLRRELSTVEPPIANPGAGYAAAIAAGALLGTLFALGCIFLGIFLYARQLRSRSKSNLKQPPPAHSLVPPSILKKSSSELNREQKTQPNETGSAPVSLESAVTAEVSEFGEFAEIAYLQSQRQLTESRRRIDPDLINEVPTEPGYLNGTSTGPSFQSYSSYLDHDGYPLNFGLPKLPPLDIQVRARGITSCETLPRIQQRQHLFLSDSAALPATRLSREAEFLAHGPTSHAYSSTVPPLEISYASVMSTPFLPPPPAGYHGEPEALPPNSLLPPQTVKQQVKDGLAQPSRLQLPAQPLDNLEPFEHPESPDEGYVGDAMDV